MRSSFSRFQSWNYEWEYIWNIDSIIGNTYSMSFASRRLFGDRLQEFEDELRGELLKMSLDGIFTDIVRTEALLAWKE